MLEDPTTREARMPWGKQAEEPAQDGTLALEYAVDVNKGSINHLALTGTLNNRAKHGWRLHSIFEQHGNTVMVYERWR
jgi:hypothetical protein